MRPPARRPLALLTSAGLAASTLALTADLGGTAGPLDVALDPAAAATAAREAEPVVLTGADLPDWSGLPAEGSPATYPSGTGDPHPFGDDARSAHNGTLRVPPGPAGVDVDRVAAYRWDEAAGWAGIPVQVDERFPYFLANGRSGFSWYSGTDVELTYAWNPTATSTGEEAWKKVAGACDARYPATVAEAQAAVDAGLIALGPDETVADLLAPMSDPATGLDLDDEVVFLAVDAGSQAPADAAPPVGVDPASRHEVLLAAPLGEAATAGVHTGAVYLFLAEDGPAFDHTSGYVDLTRDDDADRWADRSFWDPADPEKLGTSNTGYGPNLTGTVCGTAYEPLDVEAGEEPRDSKDRFPLDGMTVRTAAYEATMSGRWMFRDLAVASPQQNPGAVRNAVPGRVPGEARFAARAYGADLVDRWKGRAFQQSPDSTISLVGFEDEQINWEANSAILGWKVGPVRAIRELWGADSGTNVTKVETFYRDLIQHRYHVRVHPIPPDGLYTSWDYNRDVAETYFNALRPDGVPIDGENDDVGQVDDVNGMPAFFDAPDPTFDLPSAIYRWEQVAGAGDTGSLVYSLDITGPTTLGNPAVVPYYRDDACLDDGTGDDPVARPWPGEASTDPRVIAGYEDANGGTPYAELECWQRQGAHAAHGVHFFVTHDTDNLFLNTPVPTTEVDARQWQFAVPMSAPSNVGEAYGNVVRLPLRTVVTPQP